jgi:hypothetical protein
MRDRVAGVFHYFSYNILMVSGYLPLCGQDDVGTERAL